MMIFSVSFMNEFSHLLESQNSVNNHRLAFLFSLIFLRFYNQIRISHPSYHITQVFVELCIFVDGFTAQARRGYTAPWHSALLVPSNSDGAPADFRSQERVLAKCFRYYFKIGISV